MTVRVHNWADMQQYGVSPLTGEACAYSMRVLCDLNEDGAKLIQQFFGLPAFPAPAFAGNWNGTVNGKPSIGSIMLPHGAMNDLTRFAMFSVSKCVVVVEQGGYTGYSAEEAKEYHDMLEVWVENGHKTYSNFAAPRAVEGRNIHAMSGRAL